MAARTWYYWWIAALGVSVAVAGCARSADSWTTEEEGTASPTGSTGGGGTGVGACEPACTAPTVCSAGICVAAGNCTSDADCGKGLACDIEAGTCAPGGGCGAQEIKGDPTAPNLLVVLDRSCSMKHIVDGKMKWEIAVDALDLITTDFVGQIRFGLSLFPEPADTLASCTQDEAIPIPVGANKENEIQKLLAASLDELDENSPFQGPCDTNIDTAMSQAQGEPSFGDPAHPSSVLLLTDGKQVENCSSAGGNAGTEQIIADLLAKNVSTFVVGFGHGVDADAMNAFATAGGVPNDDPSDPSTKYYKAEDAKSLEKVLGCIAKKTLGCTFVLEQTPPNPDEIFVFLDDDPSGVPRDPSHMTGWDYDASTNTITFYGEACDKLESCVTTDVDIVFGCNEPTPT